MKSIFKRELKGYFDSPIAYIFIVVFLLINCGLYMSSFFLIGRLEIRSLFELLPFVLIVFVPAITMRLWAEERRQGTFELVMTLPVETWHITVGKFLAGFLFYAIALMGTLSIPLILWVLGGTDPGPVIGGYIGALLLGGFLLSLGIFVSGFFRDQIVAFIMAMVLAFVFFMLGTDYIASLIDGWSGGLAVGSMLKNYLGMVHHFKSVERGVLDIRDMFYFVSMSIAFLALNAIYLDGRLKKGAGKSFTVSFCIIGALLVFCNLVATGFNARFDLTEDRIFTVSESAKSILSRLVVPVRVVLYITPEERMPTVMKNLQKDIVDKLEEFKIASKGKLTYKVMDPTADPEILDSLREKGIAPFRVQSVEQDEIGVKVVYSAITVSYLEKKEEIIPAVHIQNFFNLEYDLISKVYKVSSDARPTIAVYSGEEKMDPALAKLYMQMGRPMPDNGPKFTMITELLRHEDYKVVDVDITKDSPIPPDVNTLLVLSPSKLNERQLYEISRVVTRGGNIIFAVQNYRYDYAPVGDRGMEVTPKKVFPGINPLLKNYGVGINDRLLMDNSMETLSIPAKKTIGGMFNVMMSTPVKLPVQIKVISQTMNDKVSITNNLSMLLYLWGSAIDIDKDMPDGIESTVLASTSEQSWMVPPKSSALDINDITVPAKLDPSLPIVVMLNGTFKDPYKNGPVPLWPGDEAGEVTKPEVVTSAPGKIILVGAGDMFDDNLIKAGDNGHLLMNSVDALSLGDELINIRGKQQVMRLIPKTSPLAKLWLKFLGTLLSPIIILLVGASRLFLKKKAIKNYMILDSGQ